jgi:hypothetical protein
MHYYPRFHHVLILSTASKCFVSGSHKRLSHTHNNSVSTWLQDMQIELGQQDTQQKHYDYDYDYYTPNTHTKI